MPTLTTRPLSQRPPDATDQDRARGLASWWRRHRPGDISLYLLALPGVAFFAVFAYVPMAGIIVAFKNFNPVEGILHSPWNGVDNFRFLFTSSELAHVLWNTIFLNALFIVATNVCSIALAVLFNEIHRKAVKRVTQSVILLPYFMSWMVISMMLQQILGGIGGQESLLNSMLDSIGIHGVGWYQTAGPWPAILTVVKVWQGAGYLSVIYLAAITGISEDVYEAAAIDGASRFQMAVRVTLPLLIPTVLIMLILSIGRIFYGDFGMIYAIVGDNGQLFQSTDVIDTYVFRSLRQSGDLGMTAAVGLFQSVVGFFLVITANWIARRHAPDSALF